MEDYILKNAVILTIDKERRILNNGAIVIRDDRIVAIDDTDVILSQYKAERIIDMKGFCLMPGLIDTHAHAGHALLHTVVKDTIYWMDVHNHVYDHYLSDQYWNIESRLAAIQRLQAGVTTGLSVMGSKSMCYRVSYAKEQTDGYNEVGIRNILAVGPGDHPWPQKRSDWSSGKRVRYEVSYDEAINTLDKILSQFHNANSGMTKIFVTPYKITTSLTSETESEACNHLTEFDLRNSFEMRRLAKKHHTRIHTDAFKGMVYLASKDPNALLGEDVHLQHCQGLSMDEVKIMAETKTNFSFWPTIAHFRSQAPIIEMMELGVNVAISTDAPSYSSNFDLFKNMRRAQLMVRALYNERNYLPSEKILEMTTINAAKALGLQDEIGSLELGKKADIIAINISKPHFAPFFDPASAIVRLTNISDVEYVFCNGKMLMEKGNILYEHCESILDQAQQFAEDLVVKIHAEKFAYPTEPQWGKVKAYYSEARFDAEWAEKDANSLG